MPKRSYPFDYYSHNSQTKFYMPDKDYLTVVYEKTIKRLFEAARNITSSASTSTESTEIVENVVVQQKQKEEERDLKSLSVACNQCLDTNNKKSKEKCEFCEKLNCQSKCLQACAKCSHNYCANCITMKYDNMDEAQYVCYSCK